MQRSFRQASRSVNVAVREARVQPSFRQAIRSLNGGSDATAS
jgi:hypothetical protein